MVETQLSLTQMLWIHVPGAVAGLATMIFLFEVLKKTQHSVLAAGIGVILTLLGEGLLRYFPSSWASQLVFYVGIAVAAAGFMTLLLSPARKKE